MTPIYKLRTPWKTNLKLAKLSYFAEILRKAVLLKCLLKIRKLNIIGYARNQGNCLKYLENCQNRKVIKFGLGVNKKNFSSHLGRQSVKLFCF